MATRIPILSGGGVPALDFTSLGNLPGEIMQERRQQKLTAERLQDIAEARGDRERQRTQDAAQTAVFQDPSNDFTTTAGIQDIGGRLLAAGAVQPGMGMFAQARAMEDAAFNRKVQGATLANAQAAAARARTKEAKEVRISDALRTEAENLNMNPDLAGSGIIANAIKEAGKSTKAQSKIGKIKADVDNELITPEQGQAAIDGVLSDDVTTQAKNDARKANAAFKSIDTGLTNFEQIFNKEGFATPGTAAAQQYLTARRGLQLQLKELFNLGVLNGPDLTLMDEMLIDPSGPQAAAMAATGRLPQIMKDNVKQVREIVTTLRNNTVAGAGGAATPQAGAGGVSGTTQSGVQWSVK